MLTILTCLSMLTMHAYNYAMPNCAYMLTMLTIVTYLHHAYLSYNAYHA